MNDLRHVFVVGSFVAACSAMVDRFPEPGESLSASGFTLEPGGKGFNLAVGASRLGLTVDGLFAVGDDLFAGMAERAFATEGLAAAMLSRQPGPTGSGIGFTDSRGENCLAVFPGANLRLPAADMRARKDAIARAGLVLAQFEIADEPILEAFRIARAAGVPTLLNPSPFRVPSPELLRLTTMLVANRVEARALAEAAGAASDGEDAAASALLALGPEAIVATRGSEGAAVYLRDGSVHRQQAFRVRAVDTLGAGDAFSAGLASGLVRGQSWPEALRRACACGALATRRPGVLAALPTEAEVEALLGGEFIFS